MQILFMNTSRPLSNTLHNFEINLYNYILESHFNNNLFIPINMCPQKIYVSSLNYVYKNETQAY